MKWTREHLVEAIARLANTDDLTWAIDGMSEDWSVLVTHKSIESAFRRHGLDSPRKYLGLNVDKKKPVQPDQIERLFFIPDSHVPYEDHKAFDVMLSALANYKPHRIVIQGDFADCLEMSSHPKTRNSPYSFREEMELVNGRLDQIDAIADESGTTHKEYVMGNHEYRLPRYLASNASALIGTVSYEDETQLSARGWNVTPYNDFLKIGKLHITHDVGTAGANAHKDAVAAFEGSATIGHVHRIAVSYSGNVAGSSHVGATFGWLGSRDYIDYMHKAKIARDWHLGFGTGAMLSDGTVFLQAHPIVNYQAVVNGVLIK